MRPWILRFFLLLPSCAADHDDGRAVPPACPAPAPLNVPNSGTPTDVYMVQLAKGTTDAQIDALAARHEIRGEQRFWIVPAFSATLHPQTVAALRCAPEVVGVTENRRVVAAAGAE